MSAQAPPQPTRGPGRPANGSSADTRRRLVAVARKQFAERGFDSTTVVEVARSADVVPSTFYHYFPDKESLYEAVFEATASELWREVDDAVAAQRTLSSALLAVADTAERAADRLPDHGRFLVAVPIEATRHPRFGPLLDRRTEMQRATFAHVTKLGHRTGELPAELAAAEVAEQLRAVVVGWLSERYLAGSPSRLTTAGLLRMLSLAPRPLSAQPRGNGMTRAPTTQPTSTTPSGSRTTA
jgi:AcrR family transcriptional regulator